MAKVIPHYYIFNMILENETLRFCYILLSTGKGVVTFPLDCLRRRSVRNCGIGRSGDHTLSKICPVRCVSLVWCIWMVYPFRQQRHFCNAWQPCYVIYTSAQFMWSIIVLKHKGVYRNMQQFEILPLSHIYFLNLTNDVPFCISDRKSFHDSSRSGLGYYRQLVIDQDTHYLYVGAM